MVLVSVIMPVYNSEKYVGQAVRSILNQSEKCIQIILVDDGSKDSSGKICDQIAADDERVLVIHQKNQGICAARNTGLKAAIGEYITFCDNDDIFLPGFIKENYKLAKKYNADIVRFCRRRIMSINDKTIRDSVMNNFPFCVIKREDYAKYDYEISCTGNGVWTGLYRREFIESNHIMFDESMKFGLEDCMFNLQAYQSFDTLVLNPKVYYIWMNRMEHSTTGKFDMNFINSLKKCLKQDMKLAYQHSTISSEYGSYQSKLTRAYVYILYDYLNLARNKINLKTKRAILKEFRNLKAFRIKNNYKTLKKDGLFMVVLWTFFYYRVFMLPYIAIHVKQKLFNS
jgi:glycosyltransferase involved in cell wall biosynthesis